MDFYKELSGKWESVTEETFFQKDDLLARWGSNDEVGRYLVQFLVCEVFGEKILLQRMMENGKLLKMKDRERCVIDKDEMVKGRYLFSNMIVGNSEEWPKTMGEAVRLLEEYFKEEGFVVPREIKWKEFEGKYLECGMTIRNYFGLWTGNFELMDNCGIEDIDADNASHAILYNFWEYMTR